MCLLVEDDLDLVDAFGRVLASRGFKPVCCADGHEALAWMRKRNFDAVILDLSLPGAGWSGPIGNACATLDCACRYW